MSEINAKSVYAAKEIVDNLVNQTLGKSFSKETDLQRVLEILETAKHIATLTYMDWNPSR